MVRVIPISYRNKKYPDGIVPKIEEIPAHFDSKITNSNLDYSLHTEYSYGPRKFTCSACKDLAGIKVTDSKGVPKLWFNNMWVKDFIRFILRFIGDKKPPRLIEIHPPFNDYCKNLSCFIQLYMHFEDEILSRYPKTEILVENRYGSQYSEGFFILSTVNDLKELTELIKEHNLKLRIALDFPQLFSAHHFDVGRFTKDGMSEIFKQLYPIRKCIGSIHLWGKCLGKNNRISAHMGTLDSYFKGLRCEDITADNVITLNSYTEVDASNNDDNNIKRHFLRELHNLLSDGSARYFLPEVNSKSGHLQSIVRDLIDLGFKFI
ncbi:hypothetical protein ABOONEI_2103 [Aciduliprofundum boonei T469]|nr:hypothetical protein ABOONEI_2103 [Aciduliprofundum boonei T469]